MQRRLKMVAAILPMAILLGLLGVGFAVAQLQQNGPAETTQGAQALENSQSAPANSFGAQAPYTTQYDGRLTIRADRTATMVVTKRLKVLIPAAIQALSQQQLLFIEGMQTLDVIEAFTEKPDGIRATVDPGNIITRDAASGLQATYLRDVKQRTVIFPDVGVGDTLVLTSKTETLQSLFPE